MARGCSKEIYGVVAAHLPTKLYTVELTHGGNAKPPKDEVVSTWAKNSLRNVELDVVKNLLFVLDFIVTFKSGK